MDNFELTEKTKELKKLQTELSDTDYIYFKKIEYEMMGRGIESINFVDLHKRRENIREKIRILKKEIAEITL